MGIKLRLFRTTLSGLALMLLGLLGGFLLPVGQYCSATFLPQSAAAAQDAHATSITHYEDACNAAVSQQEAIWGGLLVIGAVVVILSLVWRYSPLPAGVRAQAPWVLSPVWFGGALVFVGIVGGWAVPVAKDCSGAFGDQAPARVVAAETGTTGTLWACEQASGPMSYVWWAVIGLGAAGVALGIFRGTRFLRPGIPVPGLTPRPEFTLPERGSMVLSPDGGGGDIPGPEALLPLQRRERVSRRWPYTVAIVVLAAAVVALGAGYVYSTDSAEQWRATAEKNSRDLASTTAERDSLSAKADKLNSQLADANSKLDGTTTQLNQANDQIRSLANDKAQLGDNAALLAELIASSQKVGREMSTCIADLQKLQTYLVNYSAYDPTSLLNAVKGINSECNTARSDSDSLTQTIQGLK